MDDPANTPTVAELQQQLTNLNSKLGEQGTELGQLRQQNQELQSKIATNNKPPTQNVEPDGGSLFDWSQGTMRTDSGQVNPSLYASMQKAGAAPADVDRLISTIETAQNIVQTQKAQVVQEKVGGQQQLDSLLEWAGQNKTNPNVRAADTLIKDISTLSTGLDLLKSAAEAGGFTVGESQQTHTNTEPAPLPNATTGNTNPTLTPLVPGSPEALKAVGDSRMVSDPNYRTEITKRLELGMKN